VRPARFTITKGNRNLTYEVAFEYIGEGFDGEYDASDPNDMALWRLDLIDGNGEQVDGASWCTKLGVDELTPEQLHRVGIWISARTSKAMIEQDVSVERLWDALSHLDKSWTTDIATFNQRLDEALHP
jgi:hypothetical protein